MLGPHWGLGGLSLPAVDVVAILGDEVAQASLKALLLNEVVYLGVRLLCGQIWVVRYQHAVVVTG